MNKVKILGIPFSYGQRHPGVKHALAALKAAGLISRLETFTRVEEIGEVDFSLCEQGKSSGPILNQHASAMGCELISECIERENTRDSFLLNIGGDHGLGLGTVHAQLEKNPETIVVWADAHGDINSPEASMTGNFHGMPLHLLLHGSEGREGFGWIKRKLNPRKLIFFGPRDLDPWEKKVINEFQITYFSSEEINRVGAETLMTQALKKLDPEGIFPIHLSLDVDLFDAEDVAATGTRVVGGPNVKEIFTLGNLLGRTGRLSSMDLVEINPELGSQEDSTQTLGLALDFLEKCLGSVPKNQLLSDWYPHFSATNDVKKKNSMFL